MHEVTSFGSMVRHYRRALGLTQEELAERAGLSERAVREIERGTKHTPRKETTELLADALQLSAEERAGFMAAARKLRSNVQSVETTLQTFLIADVRGYTRFTQEQGDEAAARLASRFATLAEEVVAARDGRVVELRGDEVLAVFSSARLALRAATELQERCEAEAEADPSLPLHVGIGLDAGEAIPVAGGYRGGALNLAARLCALAGPGEVLASEAVVHLARKTAEVAYLERGAVQLKGLVDPVEVVQVVPAPLEQAPNDQGERAIYPSDGAPPVQPLPIGGFLGALPDGPLVARQEELERLGFVLDVVEGGAGRLVVLGGEAGVGKSRLAQEATIQTRDRSFVVASGGCSQQEQPVPLYPYREALRMMCAAAPPSIRSQVPGRWSRLGWLMPAIPTPSPLPSDDPEERHALFLAVAGFLVALAVEQPVALLLDDLQWADQASLDLLQHLARQTRASRILLLATCRDSALGPEHPPGRMIRDLDREGLVERLTLRRLPEEGTAALVESIVGEVEGAADLAAFAHRRTKGNPFYIHRMLRSLGGHYRLVRQIGAGGMGRVFQAVDTRTGEAVAAKLMFARSEADPRALSRFQQEGAVLATLDHPNIVRVHGTFMEEHASCIVMDLLDGQSLGEILRVGQEGADTEMPLPRVKHLMRQVASALAFAHGHGIVHRDVKPDNIMVVEDDLVQVTDFGIARLVRPAGSDLSTMTGTGMTLGTPLYMAPEQIEGHRVDGRADVYSLGAVLYQLVTGRPPFEGDDPMTVAVKHLQETLVPPRSIRSDLPADWEALILKALAKDPKDRFQTAGALEQAIVGLSEPASVHGDELEQVVGPEQPPSAAASRTVRPAPGRRRAATRMLSAVRRPWSIRLPWLGVVAGVMVLLLVAAATLVYTQHSSTATITRYRAVANWGVQGPIPGALQAPAGLALDTKGDLFVADSAANRIEEFSPSGTLLTQWGKTGSAAGELRSPHGVAVDGHDNVYVADTGNNRIQKFSSSGKVLALKGALQKPFHGIQEISVDSQGYVYALDRRGATVDVLSAEGIPIQDEQIPKNWAPWSGSGSCGSICHLLMDPIAFTVDPGGNVYVADKGTNQIREFSPVTQSVVRTIGPDATRLSDPAGVALDSQGNLYIADGARSRLIKIGPGGKILRQWGTEGMRLGQFRGPSGVTVDQAGNIYVADTGNHRVQKLAPSGRPLAVWGSRATSAGVFGLPNGVAVDRHGVVYMTDAQRNQILKFSGDGQLLAQIGSAGSGPGQFQDPGGLAVAASGAIYVADTGNNRVQELSAAGRPIREWGTKGTAPGQLLGVSDVAVGVDGTVVVDDRENARIQTFSSTGTFLGLWGHLGTSATAPTSLAVDRQGNLYLPAFDPNAQQFAVRKISPQGQTLSYLAVGALLSPNGVAVDGAGNIYVADEFMERVLKFSPTGKLLAKLGTSGSGPGALAFPRGVAVDDRGDVYVADQGGGRIVKFVPQG